MSRVDRRQELGRAKARLLLVVTGRVPELPWWCRSYLHTDKGRSTSPSPRHIGSPQSPPRRETPPSLLGRAEVCHLRRPTQAGTDPTSRTPAQLGVVAVHLRRNDRFRLRDNDATQGLRSNGWPGSGHHGDGGARGRRHERTAVAAPWGRAPARPSDGSDQ